MADGGEGSVAATCAGRFGSEKIMVTGPTGRPVTAEVAVRGRTVLIEAAAICGLGVLPGGRKAPLTATSRGIGQALQYALADEADTIVLALGGVATTDGGAGLLQSLGATLAGEDGTPIGLGGAGLAALRTVHLAEARAALAGVDLVLATDVDNPLLGTAGAAAVYGPQKGATASEVRELDDALAGFVRRLEAAGVAEAAGLADVPGAGAAGGLGYAGMLLGGRVRSWPTTSSPRSVPTNCWPGATSSSPARATRESLQIRKTWSGEREARLDAFRWLDRYNTCGASAVVGPLDRLMFRDRMKPRAAECVNDFQVDAEDGSVLEEVLAWRIVR
ncbi:glycerate kinase [Streptomyces sp. CA-210063]|uniref:glycerate kinase n=1 Tax=Streptomyces sp. CA-210063 TaxID=2801029 RepID=UPI00214CA1F8|nr:glycerate kinase [Streptomyces sp. CA-210063]UUU29102.1 glycerate kinase [Streptomyces sp. CA-210063]